ncbi:NAD(P)/FAD-dependent oxidoreductase [Microbacterium sp. zg.Y909]|uniref:NAD(P)/FAD-dependent oxidoreductase n=1 Tax=Microbacterium sp. zg.Y909 TaxID=2969413 RepID=UPI00214C4E41|nr:FAD-dependent oxidoreductase [Microbacterium sp. zg.Y909]
MDSPIGDVVIVGAGVSGTRLAQSLRRGGHEGAITLLSAEAHAPYDRPPLSKDLLKGDKALADITLATQQQLQDAGIDLRLSARVDAIDREEREAVLADGARVGYDTLVVATGVRPLQLPAAQKSHRVHALSTIDDCRRLREDLSAAHRIAMVGAGFIGSEIAATARQMGRDVTLIGGTDYPLARVAGPWVGARIAALHARNGVDVRMRAVAAEFVDHDGGVTIRFIDGSETHADLVVMGVGSVPVTDWLESSGLEIEGGVIVDAAGRTADPAIWAVGDVARHRREDGTSVRHQHWTSATEQADALARRFTGRQPSPLPQVDYVWSDLYGKRLQVFGAIPKHAEPQVLIDEPDRFLVAYSQEGRLSAMLGMGVAGKFMRFRGPVALGQRLESVLAHV